MKTIKWSTAKSRDKIQDQFLRKNSSHNLKIKLIVFPIVLKVKGKLLSMIYLYFVESATTKVGCLLRKEMRMVSN